MKNKPMQKFSKLATASALTLAMLLAGGCAGNAASSKPAATSSAKTPTSSVETEDPMFNKGGEFPICKETVSLSIGITEDAYIEDLETNLQTVALEKQGNFDLTYHTYPSSDFSTKINLMVQSGGNDLPDIIMGSFTDSMTFSFAKAKAIVPLTEYYADKDASYYIQDGIKRTGVDFTKQIVSPDGEIYGIAAYNQSLTNETMNKLWIYQPWLDAVGMKAPTTPDELYSLFEAFQGKDLNKNSKNDEVCLVGAAGNLAWFDALMNPFIYAGNSDRTAAGNGDRFNVENGKVSVPYNTEEWREGLRFIKKMYDAGMISPLTFTQDSTQWKAMLQGEEPIVGMYVGSPSALKANERRLEYTGIAPLIGENGNQYATYVPQVASVAMIISKNCKNPEAAFRLGDLLCSSDMGIWTRWGVENTDWKWADKTDLSLFASMGYGPTIKVINDVYSGIQNQCLRKGVPFIREYAIALGVTSNGDPTESSARIASCQPLYTDKIPKERIEKLIFTDEENDAIGETMTTLKTTFQEYISLFITGAKSIDTDWDAYIKELDTIGLPTVLKTVQTVYDRMNG